MRNAVSARDRPRNAATSLVQIGASGMRNYVSVSRLSCELLSADSRGCRHGDSALPLSHLLPDQTLP
jgi:hypothetical protein